MRLGYIPPIIVFYHIDQALSKVKMLTTPCYFPQTFGLPGKLTHYIGGFGSVLLTCSRISL